MSSMRGTWLGWTIGIILFAVLYERKVLFLILIICSLFLLSPDRKIYLEEISSIGNINEKDHNNYSNNARLHLWRSGAKFALDYKLTGTGIKNNGMIPGNKNADSYFKRFFENQSPEFQKKNHLALDYPGNFHNCYLQIMTEAGILYFILFLGSLLYILFILAFKLKYIDSKNRSYSIAIIIISAAFFVTNFFHGELHSYGANAYYLIFFAACFTADKNITWGFNFNKKQLTN